MQENQTIKHVSTEDVKLIYSYMNLDSMQISAVNSERRAPAPRIRFKCQERGEMKQVNLLY